MKSAFLTGPKKFELRDIPEPIVPDDGLVLGVRACGICGSDLRRWKEGPPQNTDSITPGHEISGVVIEVGKDVTGISPGDRLAVAPDIHCSKCYYCQRELYNLCNDLRFLGITSGYPGGFAEKMLLTGEILTNGIVHHMPDGLSFVDAAVAEPICSVLALYERAGIKKGDKIVVMGAGPVGCLHVVVAKTKGAIVIISEPNKDRRKMAQNFAPDAIIDPDNENLGERVRKFTDNIGADIVICANPFAQTQTKAVEIVRKRGRVILFGGLPRNSPMTTLNGNLIHYGEIEIIGSFSYHPDIHKLALDMLWRKLIPTEFLITHKFPLENINEAYETAASGKALKVVITA